jgi:hypothetical protein
MRVRLSHDGTGPSSGGDDVSMIGRWIAIELLWMRSPRVEELDGAITERTSHEARMALR